MPKIQCDIAVIGNDVIGLCCGYALKSLVYPSNLSLSVRVHAIGLHLGLAFILAKASLTGPQSYHGVRRVHSYLHSNSARAKLG